jgi:hypothetical protein
MPKPRPRPRFRCRFCGVTFSAWLAVPGEPDGALLLHHIRQSHPAELKPFLDQMHTDDDITPAIVQAYEAVDEPMSEPHVVALYYRLETTEALLRFENPPPREDETALCTFRLADNMLTCTMKAHYDSVDKARKEVECLLRAMGEQLRDQAPLGVCERDGPCGPRLRPPRRHAVLSHLRQPLADGRWGDRKRVSHLPRLPPVWLELNRPLSPCRLPAFGASLLSVHVRSLAHGKN